MKMDAKKKKLSNHLVWPVILIAGLLIVGLATTAYKKSQDPLSAFNVYYQRMQIWLAERKQNWHKNLKQVKQIASNKKEAPPEIHFEFYTALENMQIPAADVNANKPKVPVIKTASNKQNVSEPNAAIFSANDIEQEFSSQLNRGNFIIQLGTFKNFASAEHLRKTMSDAGFTVRVIKWSEPGNEIYKVQLGPFSSKEEARVSQLKLQKRGINGMLRKIELG